MQSASGDLEKQLKSKSTLAGALQRKLKQANERIEELEKSNLEQKEMATRQKHKYEEELEEKDILIDEQEQQLAKLKAQLLKAKQQEDKQGATDGLLHFASQIQQMHSQINGGSQQNIISSPSPPITPGLSKKSSAIESEDDVTATKLKEKVDSLTTETFSLKE